VASFSGLYTVVLTPDADLRALDPGSYYWDVQYTVSGAAPVTVCGGRWTQKGDVTR